MKNKILKIFISVGIISFLFLIIPSSASAYSLETHPATYVTDTSAVLTGSFDIQDADKTVETWFRYGTSNFDNQGGYASTEEKNHTENDGPFSDTISNLQPNTTYYYVACFRRSGVNCQQSYKVTFKTLVKITPPTSLASETLAVTGSEAKLKGSWTSNGTGTAVWFEYGTTSGVFGSLSSLEDHGGSGSTIQILGNLSLSTTYFYRFVAKNSAGVTYGPIQTFKTSSAYSPPISTSTADPSIAQIITYDASEVTDTTAKLSGWASPDTGPTTVYFRYSQMAIPPVFCNDIYGNNMISTDDIKLTTSSSFSQEVSDLRPDTTYYYCAIASSKKGINYAEDKPNNPLVKYFKTLPCPGCAALGIETKPASAITKNSAILNSRFSTKQPATVWFEYGKNNEIYTGAEKTAGSQNVGQNASGNPSFYLSGITGNTIYRYRAVIKKSNGEINKGAVVTFRTKSTNSVDPCPPKKKPIIYTYDKVPSVLRSIPHSWYQPFEQIGEEKPFEESPFSIGVGIPVVGPFKPKSVGGSIIVNPIGGGLPHITPGGSIIIADIDDPCPPENPPPRPYHPTTPTTGGSSSTGGGTSVFPGTGIPVDAIVRFQEGVEHVFVRQIIGIPEIAKAYGYQSSLDLTQFANDLAHKLAQIFGYYDKKKEIRVLPPDIAAYELKLGSDGLLMVNEYYAGILISSRKINDAFKKPPTSYEYNYQGL